MEKKIDAMMEIITHLKDTKEMMEQHHRERMSGNDRLINVISEQGKGKGKGKRSRKESSSSSN